MKYLSKLINVCRLVKLRFKESRPSFGSIRVGTRPRYWFLYVSLRDKRGRRLALHGLSQPKLRETWMKACSALKPNLIIDVGANYGEFGLGNEIPSAEEIWLIEANTAICKYLEKSVSNCPFGQKVKVINAIAVPTHLHGSTQSIFINSNWSGTSSVVSPDSKEGFTKVEVASVAIDAIIGAGSRSCVLLAFKIDVEGYEGMVMDGMKKIITEADKCFGIIEFNQTALRRADTDPEEFLDTLLQIGEVYHINDKNGQLISLHDSNLSNIPDGKTDIIVTKNANIQSLINCNYWLRP